MAINNPIGFLPNGFQPTVAALSGVNVSTVSENSVVTTLGGVTPGDGLGSTYYFQAASVQAADGIRVIGTSTTGRWLGLNGAASFSGVGPLTASQTGFSETFILVSGFAPVVYTLPPTQNVLYKQIVVKTLTTGTVTIRTANATDLIVDTSPTSPVAPVASLTTTLTGGMSFDFIAYPSRFYRIDKPSSVV